MKQVVFLSFAVILVGCTEPTREEVLFRFETGEKRIVAVYRGSGSGESLVERQTYDRTGRLVLLEDLESGTTQSFVELNPEIRTATGLEDFLAGEWHERKQVTITRSIEHIEQNVFTFEDNSVDVAYTYIDVPDDEEWNDSFSYPVSYSDDLRLAIDYGEDIDPEPLSAFTDVEIIDPQTVMLRYYRVFESDIQLPTGSVNRLHRNEENAEFEQAVWGTEYDELLRALIEEREALIAEHFPEWAERLNLEKAQRRAESDRSSADILDMIEYRRSRSEALVEFLAELGMTLEEYREHASMTVEEFNRIYLFVDDGTIPPKTSWNYVQTTDPITSEVFARASVSNSQGSFWIYKTGDRIIAGLRPDRSVSFGAERLVMRVDENDAYSIDILNRNDNGNTFVVLQPQHIQQIQSGTELLIQYDGLSGRTLVRFPLDGITAAIAQLD